jgi:hypothetical protein
MEGKMKTKAARLKDQIRRGSKVSAVCKKKLETSLFIAEQSAQAKEKPFEPRKIQRQAKRRRMISHAVEHAIFVALGKTPKDIGINRLKLGRMIVQFADDVQDAGV